MLCIFYHTHTKIPWIPEFTFLLRRAGRTLSNARQECCRLNRRRAHGVRVPHAFPGTLWAKVRACRTLDFSLRNGFSIGTRTNLSETAREICRRYPPPLLKSPVHTQESCFPGVEGICIPVCSSRGTAAGHVNDDFISESGYHSPGCVNSGGSWQVLAVGADLKTGPGLAPEWSPAESGNLERKLVANRSPATGLLTLRPVWHSPSEV